MKRLRKAVRLVRSLTRINPLFDDDYQETCECAELVDAARLLVARRTRWPSGAKVYTRSDAIRDGRSMHFMAKGRMRSTDKA